MFPQVTTLRPIGLDKGRLIRQLEATGLDAGVVCSPEGVYYLTGYPTLPTSGNPILYSLRNVFPYGVVLEGDGTRHLICWGFSLEGVDVDVEHVHVFNDRGEALSAFEQVLVEALSRRSAAQAATVGLEESAPFAITEIVRRLPDTVPVPLDPLMLSLRRVKSRKEVAALQKSVAVAEGALQRVLESLRVTGSRLEAIRLAKVAVLELGGDGVGHVTMSFGDANPEIATDEFLHEGALVVVDVGAKVAGYTSDCRRYAFAGPVPEVVRSRHAATCSVVDAVADALMPGVPFAQLTRLAEELFRDAGLQLLGRFTHVGHGIGLETEEEWIDGDEARYVEEDMVVAIELYTDVAPYGTIGDEETYVVRADGAHRLSLIERHIRQIATT